MEALVNSLDTAALSREQLEAEVAKLRSENDQLRMDTDDPFHLLRDLPEDEPRPSPSKRALTPSSSGWGCNAQKGQALETTP